jgi:hypothetical protein
LIQKAPHGASAQRLRGFGEMHVAQWQWPDVLTKIPVI